MSTPEYKKIYFNVTPDIYGPYTYKHMLIFFRFVIYQINNGRIKIDQAFLKHTPHALFSINILTIRAQN